MSNNNIDLSWEFISVSVESTENKPTYTNCSIC